MDNISKLKKVLLSIFPNSNIMLSDMIGNGKVDFEPDHDDPHNWYDVELNTPESDFDYFYVIDYGNHYVFHTKDPVGKPGQFPKDQSTFTTAQEFAQLANDWNKWKRHFKTLHESDNLMLSRIKHLIRY
jgi:hypothetical protein